MVLHVSNVLKLQRVSCQKFDEFKMLQKFCQKLHVSVVNLTVGGIVFYVEAKFVITIQFIIYLGFYGKPWTYAQREELFKR